MVTQQYARNQTFLNRFVFYIDAMIDTLNSLHPEEFSCTQKPGTLTARFGLADRLNATISYAGKPAVKLECSKSGILGGHRYIRVLNNSLVDSVRSVAEDINGNYGLVLRIKEKG